MKLYPLFFTPLYKEKIWGGQQIKEHFNRRIESDHIGESWEIAAHPHGTNTVNNGHLKGEKLTDLIKKFGEKILGNKVAYQPDNFPLLIKFLDIDRKISVQVHPDNAYARRADQEDGKTEMWYIIKAKAGARLNYGLLPGTTREELAQAVAENRVEDYLNYVEVKSGDTFYIPAGLVHTLDPGILLAEIQQNSDATYRLYDWNRTDQNGNPRPLHIEKALDVINFEKGIIPQKEQTLQLKEPNYTRSILAACPYFVTEKIQLKNEYIINPAGERFYILIFLSGQGKITDGNETYYPQPGNTVLLPAELDQLVISGNTEFLISYLPSGKEQFVSSLQGLGFTQEQISDLNGVKDF